MIAASTNIRGEVIILKRFRAVYVLLNEVYLTTVCYSHDYPFDAIRLTNHAKELLFDTCRSVDVTVAELYKSYGQVVLALEELINETNTFKTPITPFEIVAKKEKVFATAKGSLTSRFKKERRSTMKKMEKGGELNSVVTNWDESKKQVEAHKAIFDSLAKSVISSTDVFERVEALLDIQFGEAFAPPDESPRNAQTILSNATYATRKTVEVIEATSYNPYQNGNDINSQAMLNNFNLLTLDTSTASENDNSENTDSSDLITSMTSGNDRKTPLPPPPVIPPKTASNQAPVAPTLESLLDFSDDPTPVVDTTVNTVPQPLPILETLTASAPAPPPLPPVIPVQPVKQPESLTPSKPIAPLPVNPTEIKLTPPVAIPTKPAAVFDPSQIIQKFKERAKVIPFTVVISEVINAVVKNGVIQSYQLLGQISVKKASSEATLYDPSYSFTLLLKNTGNLHSFVCNTKFCTQDGSDYKFKCEVPSSAVNQDQTLGLLKYKIDPSMTPLPVNITSLYQTVASEKIIKLLLTYTESMPTSSLSILITPVEEGSSSGLVVVAAQSKPEGRWNATQQKLLWKFDGKHPTESENRLLARFKTNNDPTSAKFGPVFVKFTCDNVFGNFEVEGCQQKKESTNEVFLGGCEKSVQSGKFEFYFDTPSASSQ